MTLASIETAIIDKLLIYGPLGLIVLFVFFVIRKYGPPLIDEAIAFIRHTSSKVDKITEASMRQADNSERQASSTEQLVTNGATQARMLEQLCDATKQHHDTKGAAVYHDHIFSNTRTNKALQLLCRAKLLETTNEPARQLIDEAIRTLDGSLQ